MSDFMKEIKLSNEAYYHWQNIKEEIQSEKLFVYNANQSTQSIIYTFSSSEIANEVINFMKEQAERNYLYSKKFYDVQKDNNRINFYKAFEKQCTT